MPLYLSGGGSGKQSEEIDRLFSKNVDKSKPIIYIPIAIDANKHPYPECLKWLKNNFKPYGLEHFVMCTEDNYKEYICQDPNSFGGIYIGGGNTFYLLKILKSTKLMDFLIESYKKGIHIAGGSAGAIIFGKTIASSYLDDLNEVHIRNISGIDLLNGYDISAHYMDERMKSLSDIMIKYRVKDILAIPEDSSLYIDKTIKVIGKSPITIFHNSKVKIIMPNSILKLE